MDMDITMERLINDLEGVISQINDIVARKDIQAARRAMEQIAEIVRADNPDVELDTRVDPNYDHVLHELLSRINGVIETQAQKTYVIDETEESKEVLEELRLIDEEINQIDEEINNIRRSGKSTRAIPTGEEEITETVEDQTLDEINRRIEELTQRRIELLAQLRELRENDNDIDDAWVNLKNQIDELNKEIADLEAQREALKAQSRVTPNIDIDDLTRQIAELRGQVSQSEDEINDEIARLEQEIADLRQNATYVEVNRAPGDSFTMGNRSLNTNNFAQGAVARFGTTEVELDPEVHRFRQELAQDVYGGENEDGVVGETVLEEMDPEVQRQIEERRRAIEERQQALQNRKAIFDKIAELEALLEAAKVTRSRNTHDRIIELEQEIADLEQRRYREAGREPGDSFAMRYRNLDINNFEAGTQIRIGNQEITLDPATHRFRQELAQDVYGGENEDGVVGEIVLEEIDPEVQQQLDARRQELNDLLKSLIPDRSAEIAELDEKIRTLKEKARLLGEDLKKLDGKDDLYAQTYALLVSTNEEIKRLEEERLNLLQVTTTRTRRGPTKVIKSDAKLTEEQQARIQLLLKKKEELLLRRKEVVKQVRRHQRVVTTGEGEKYDLTAVARELGDPFFKTHAIREELAQRGVTDEDYIRFYEDGISKFKNRYAQLNSQITDIQKEVAELCLGPDGENLSQLLNDKEISKADKLKYLEMLRKNFFGNEKFKAQMVEAGFDKELTEANMDEFATFFDTYQKDTIITLHNMQAEAEEIKFNIKVLQFEIDSIQRGRQAELDAQDDGKRITEDVEADKKLRDEQIATTMYGNPEMEAKWDETVKRFYSHRKVAQEPLLFKNKDGKVISVSYDEIEDYEGREADAHFLNLDDYNTFLKLTTAYDNAEKEEPGSGLEMVKQNFDFFTNNPAFADAYNKVLAEQGQEAADKLLLEYINEKKEYVKTFHGLTNREAVKHATLATSGSTLTAMRPVRGNLPTPVKMGNAISNVFRFIGLRAPHFTKIDADGNKVLTIKSGIGTLLTDALVIGAGALAITSGPVGIATWAAAYGVRGAVTAGNVIAGRRYYKKHKDVIDAGLPTLAEPPAYTKEVARRDYYREQIMEKTGKAEVGLVRQFTTWVHAKTDRLPFRKAAREATNKAIVEAQQGRMHDEIDGNVAERIEVTKRNAAQAKANREIRDANRAKEAKSQVTYNSVLRDPNQQDMDAMTSNVSVNAAIRSRGSTLRVDVAKGTVGTAEEVGAGRYKKPDEELEQTQGMEVAPENATTMTAVTAITEEEHYQGEKEHRDFWNRVITAIGTVAAGMAIRYGYSKFVESRMTDPGTQESTSIKHHDEETTQEWVDGHTETQNVDTTVPDYAEQYDLHGHTLEDITQANNGRQVTGYYSVSGGETGPQQITVSGSDKITAIWQDDGSQWGTGLGDTAGLSQHTGFIDRTVEAAMMDGNGVMRQGISIEDLANAVGQGKVDPATLQGTYVSLGDHHWVSLQDLMEGMKTQVQVGSHIESIPTDVWIPGEYVTRTIPAWDEPITIPGTPPTYEDVFSWKLFQDALTKSALTGAAAGIIPDALHEASRATYRTSVDGIGRNGGRFEDRNGILARSPSLIAKMVEQQKEGVMKKRGKVKDKDKDKDKDKEPSDEILDGDYEVIDEEDPEK